MNNKHKKLFGKLKNEFIFLFFSIDFNLLFRYLECLIHGLAILSSVGQGIDKYLFKYFSVGK